MTNAYRMVQWNAHKKIYDLILLGWIFLYLISFILLGTIFFPAPADISFPVLLIRALGTCALILLHIILIVGPVSRLTSRVNPILYNRRHMGVMFFTLAALHGALNILYYGGFGIINPIIAILMGSIVQSGVPYELFGFVSLCIFALMASTSHDFWLANLGHSFWKLLHMGIYFAYALVIAHVIFGSFASERNLIYPLAMTLGALCVAALHLVAGLVEVRRDHQIDSTDADSPWVDVCSVDEIPETRAKIVQIDSNERIAIFKHNNSLSAMTNICAHQGGPLGEGKIVNGCVTCPWHGYQYLPESGQSPPPYQEKIATYDIQINGDRVLINPVPNAPGTHVTPSPCPPLSTEGPDGTEH